MTRLNTTLKSLGASALLLVFIVSTPSYSQGYKADIPINVTCKDDSTCEAAINGSECADTGYCTCPQNVSVFVNTSDESSQYYCVPSLNLTTHGCKFKAQCAYNHGECVNGVCSCEDGFYDSGKACKKGKTMIVPIAVGSVLGALILCVIGVYLCRGNKTEN